MDRAPYCARCRRRHLPALPCWASSYSQGLRDRVLGLYGDSCCHCGGPGCTTVEHIRPRSACGTDEMSNLRPAHKGCNSRRGTGPMAGYTPVSTVQSPRWRAGYDSAKSVVVTKSDRW